MVYHVFLCVFLHLWFCFFLLIFSHVVTFVWSASFLCVSPVIYGERNTLTNLLGSLSLLFNYCLFTFSISALILSLPPVLFIIFYFDILDSSCLTQFSFLILYPLSFYFILASCFQGNGYFVPAENHCLISHWPGFEPGQWAHSVWCNSGSPAVIHSPGQVASQLGSIQYLLELTSRILARI